MNIFMFIIPICLLVLVDSFFPSALLSSLSLFSWTGDGMSGMSIFGGLLRLAIFRRTFSTSSAYKAHSPSTSVKILKCRSPLKPDSHLPLFADVNPAGSFPTLLFPPPILLCRGLSILNLHANLSCNF